MAGYLGASPVPQSIQKKESFTATASQTTFNTTGYTDGNFINVYLNGVRLINGTDYTATNGSDIVLTTGAIANDVLDFETFNEFTLVDQDLTTPTLTGATLKSNVTLKNDTEEDSDGGRASKIIYQGEQSGGEISTLAEIQASHDGASDDEKGDLIFRTNDGSDGTSPTEAVRIDSGQNLLVGQTTASDSAAGVYVAGSGRTSIIRDGGFAIRANRLTSEGDIIRVAKDGTTIGNLGVRASDNLYINSPHNGIEFTNTDMRPIDGNGDRTDGTSDIGDASNRFKDLYLSGGAYIGGTGAANFLDDYEEGTWTPQLDSGVGTPSYSEQHGRYTKIGRQVMAFFWMELNGGSPTGDNLRIINLPFTNVNDGKSYQVTTGYVNSSAGFGTTLTFILFPNETRLRAYQQGTTGVTQLTGSNLGNSFSFLGRVLYFV